ncbi:MAG: glucose-1-phosphate cytidylyltransferase [Euryarchaeota archaeon]|nr:glucose-1-phosphate cytidylyltransferase [Euryarchaeota archaeon]
MAEKPEVIILCGGRGSRLSEETETKPKPMVEIGGKPILWHIMKTYAHYNFTKFILALGYRGDYIKKYFYDYRITSNDFTLEMHPDRSPKIHNIPEENEWEITFVDTGLETLKGARIKRVEKHIKSDNFHLTYGDGVSDVNIKRLFDYHTAHNNIGTLTAVRPPSRFGEINLSGDKILSFEEKPQLGTSYINGGFFVFKREFFDYVQPNIDCDFEFGPLQKLAHDGRLYAFKHEGFWQCMDNIRERDYLNKLWDENKAKWKVWK